jgi:hypothetical protein
MTIRPVLIDELRREFRQRMQQTEQQSVARKTETG